MTDLDRTREHLEVLADALTLPGEAEIRAGERRRIARWLRARAKGIDVYDAPTSYVAAALESAATDLEREAT